MSTSLQIRQLNKTYENGVRALADVTLDIPTGMFGLLGPNGAGKSSLMRTLATLQEADSGTVKLGDIDVLRDKESVRRCLGYLPQDFGLYPNIDAVTALTHFAALKGIVQRSERKAMVEHLLQRVNLWSHRKKKLGGYSGGMRQRFGIAQALLGQPRLIIVDEPTAGLDPEERNRFLDLLAEIGEHVIVILSTHIVEDVADLCRQMAILGQGRVLHHGDPREAMALLRGTIWRKVIARDELESCKEQYDIISNRLSHGRTAIHVRAPQAPDPSFEAVLPSLADFYFGTLASTRKHDNGIPATEVAQ